jgi:hypothetical protein
MGHRWFASLAIIVALLGGAIPVAAGGPEFVGNTGGQPGPMQLTVVRSDESEIVFELLTPGYTLQTNPDGYTKVRVPDAATGSEPGLPELPQYGTMLGVPIGAKWELDVISTDRIVIPTSMRIAPVTTLRVPAASSLGVQSGAADVDAVEERIEDSATYARNAFFPQEQVSAQDGGYLRDQRVVSIRIYPFRYNPTSGQVEWIRQIRARLRLQMDPTVRVVAGERDGYFEPSLRSAIANYTSALAWRGRHPSVVSSEATAGGCETPGPVKILVDRDGMVQLGRNDLVAAGLPVGELDPRTLKVCYHGQEVAAQVDGQTDGRFDPGDRVLFYGVANTGRFTSTSTFWLSYGGATGKRMSQRSGAPSLATPLASSHVMTQTAEEDGGYRASYSPTPKGDHWFYAGELWLNPSESNSDTRSVEVVGSPTGSGSATLRIGVQGVTSDPYLLRVSLNGVALGTRSWTGADYQVLTFTVAPALVRTGVNDVRFTNAATSGGLKRVLLDTMALEFSAGIGAQGGVIRFTGRAGTWRYRATGFADATPVAYDVTDPMNVVRLTGSVVHEQTTIFMPILARTRVVGGVEAEAEAAVAVGASSGRYTLTFQDAAGSPHRYWAGQQDAIRAPKAIITDEYSSLRSATNTADYIIITHPDFLSAANRLAVQRRTDGLLVKVVKVQDVYDEFSYGEINPEGIRSFLSYAYTYWGNGVVHPSYALLVGDGSFDYKDNFRQGIPEFIPPHLMESVYGETANDLWYVEFGGEASLPSMYIGRLPVASLIEADRAVDKILAYAGASASGGWTTRMVLVADNTYDESGLNPGADPDFAASSDALFADYVKAPYSGTRLYYDPRPSSAGLPGRYQDETQLRIALLNAFNSGALLWNYMGHSSQEQWMSPEQVFHARDASALVNAPKFPVLLSMTCLTGAFQEAQIRTMDERLVVAAGGVVASWSPTTFGHATGHDVLQRAFYREFVTHGQHQLGRVVAAGIQDAHTNGWGALANTFVLLGDPAMMIR